MKKILILVVAGLFICGIAGAQEKVLFSDDFSKDSKKWEVLKGTWELQKGEYASTDASGEGLVAAGDEKWKDYSYELRVKTDAPGSESWYTAWIIFRVADESTWYYVLLHSGKNLIEMGKRVSGQGKSWIAGSSSEAVADPKEWNKFKIECKGDNIKVFVNGKQCIDFTDPEPIEAGKIGVYSLACEGRVDDVKVTELKK